MTTEFWAELEQGRIHKNDVWFYDAPLPPRFHRCKPWTSGITSGGHSVNRCACGGMNYGDGWFMKNDRRGKFFSRRKA